MRLKNAALAIYDIYSCNYGYDELKWIEQNGKLIQLAMKSGLSLCGSIGLAVATRHPRKLPSDIDFVTDSETDVEIFLESIESFLKTKSVFYSLMVNHNTKFCPKYVKSHYRLKVPFWMECCIFVLDNKVSSFWVNGVKVQDYKQMYDAAKELESIDGKKRVTMPECDYKNVDEATASIEQFDEEYDIDCDMSQPTESLSFTTKPYGVQG